jgi:hypothetical protein
MKKSLFISFVAVCFLISSGFEAKGQLSKIVGNFLNSYSNSLLYGTYQDHADLFANPTYFEGTKYIKAGITKVAKNFYSNYVTISHYFEVIVYEYSDRESTEIMILAVEHQMVKNRKTGKVSSTQDMKRIDLIYQNGWKCSGKMHASLR